MTKHQRTEIVTRSGDTHVIDPSVEHAEAVNIDQLDRSGIAQDVDAAPPSRLREGLGEGVSPIADRTDPPLTPPASGRGIKAAKPDAPADPITPNAE